MKGMKYQHNLQNIVPSEECSDKSHDIHSLAALPKNALTLEEVERNHVINATKPAADPAALPSPLAGAVALADLERQLLMRPSGHVTVSIPDVDRSTSVLPPDSRIPPMIPPPPPPLQRLPFPMLPPFAMQITRAHLLGQLPELPPGFPPITPQMRAAILSLGPPPMMRMPSHPLLPPFPFMQQPSHI
ncbi:hypothetical protein WUBG_17261, partial [Wuchereria bancrofti]